MAALRVLTPMAGCIGKPTIDPVSFVACADSAGRCHLRNRVTMGLFIGAFNLRGEAIAADSERALAEAVSRRPDDHRVLARRGSLVVAHVQRGADAAHLHLGGVDVWLAGRPLFEPVGTCGDIERLAQALPSDVDALCRRARGQYCFAAFDARHTRMMLATDQLGIRPLYYGEHQGVVYFATAMRMLLAACPALGDEADLAGQMQFVTLGFTIGSATPYRRIRAVAPGQVVQFEQGERTLRQVYDRAALARRRPLPDESALARDLAARFVEAVALRQRPAAAAVAYLSGGLDSRCVVAALRRHPTRPVHTINFAPDGSADLALGRLAAQALKTRHFEHHQGSPDFWARTVESVRAWHATRIGPVDGVVPEAAAGFGGETLLAPTNLTSSMLSSLAARRTTDALRCFIDDHCNGIVTRLFRKRWRDQLPQLLLHSMADELAACTRDDPERGMHLFLLMNEPRGHLAQHFEDLDLRAIEWTLPFFDRAVVELALQLPPAALLRHRFYYRWLDEFGAAVAGVPWQAYPGSLPCPWPLPDGLRNQWSDGWLDAKARRDELQQLARRVARHLNSPRFPNALLDRRVVWLACLLTRLGSSRYGYLLHPVDLFARRSARSYC